jgi:hypothetical protein
LHVQNATGTTNGTPTKDKAIELAIEHDSDLHMACQSFDHAHSELSNDVCSLDNRTRYPKPGQRPLTPRQRFFCDLYRDILPELEQQSSASSGAESCGKSEKGSVLDKSKDDFIV